MEEKKWKCVFLSWISNPSKDRKTEKDSEKKNQDKKNKEGKSKKEQAVKHEAGKCER